MSLKRSILSPILAFLGHFPSQCDRKSSELHAETKTNRVLHPLWGKDGMKQNPLWGKDGMKQNPVWGKDGMKQNPVCGKDGMKQNLVWRKDGMK